MGGVRFYAKKSRCKIHRHYSGQLFCIRTQYEKNYNYGAQRSSLNVAFTCGSNIALKPYTLY